MRKGEQRRWIVPDGLWERIEPLLPKVERPYRYPGRERLPDRKVLRGSCSCCTPGSRGGVPSPATGVRVGHDVLAGAWPNGTSPGWRRLHALLLAELHAADKLDWSKAVIDSSHLRALRGGPKSDRARPTARTGSKHHVIADDAGIPLAISLTAATATTSPNCSR